MDVILESKDAAEPELKTFTENRVKRSLKNIFWVVRNIRIKYSQSQSLKNVNENCLIELQTFDHQKIEVSITARDKRVALDMGLKKVYKHLQKVLHKTQKYGRISKHVYV